MLFYFWFFFTPFTFQCLLKIHSHCKRMSRKKSYRLIWDVAICCIELHCELFKCDESATSYRRSEMCVVTVWGWFPQWDRDSGNAPLTFSSPYLEWQSWTHAQFQHLASMACLGESSHWGWSLQKHQGQSISYLVSVHKCRPPLSPQGHKRLDPHFLSAAWLSWAAFHPDGYSHHH